MLARIVFSWILKVGIKVQEKKTSVVVLLRRKIRQFHFVIVQRRHGNAQKSVMLVQSCFFALISNLLVFCRSRCPRRRPCLSSL